MGVPKIYAGTDVRKIGCNRTSPQAFAYNGAIGYDGTDQSLVVPSGVHSIVAVLDGAEGGGSGDSQVAGGKGGRIETTLAVTPGETLTLRIGGSVAPNGFGYGTSGWNGGGSAGHGGAAGGGATTIHRGGTLLAVAGGGGGAGDAAPGETTGAGGDGGGATGQSGANGYTGYGTSGGGGTPSAGGAVGTPTASSGSAGSSLQGGVGAHDASFGDYGGGAGGGGYYGGGGGGRGGAGHVGSPPNQGAGGGGGGSSYSSGTSTTHTQGVRAGHGQATIAWTAPTGRLKGFFDGRIWREACDNDSAYAAEVLEDNPAVYLRLGDAPGSTTAVDSSGNSRTASTVSGFAAVDFGQPGLLGSDTDTAALLPGYLYVPYGSWMNVSVLTVEAIIQAGVYSLNPRSIWDRDNLASTRVFQFRLTELGKVQFILIGSSVVVATGATSVDDGVTHHLAASYDGSIIKVYVDGVLDGSTSTSVALPTGTTDLHVGVNRSGGGGAYVQGYSGFLDEAAFYPAALSATRIAAHAAAVAGPERRPLKVWDGTAVQTVCMTPA